MPELDGWQVLQALRADASTAQIPVIIMSVRDDAGEALDRGADAVVGKPLVAKDVRRAISDARAEIARKSTLSDKVA